LPAALAVAAQLGLTGPAARADHPHGAAVHPAGPGKSATLCGQASQPPAIQHVIMIMLENDSYNQVIGQPGIAPYQNWVAQHCGVGTEMFATTHSSAADYLAVSSGEYPQHSPKGCGSVGQCADPHPSLYSQLTAAGLIWGGYQESMPSRCDPHSSTADAYKIGHNPAIFYTQITAAQCHANDVGVPNLAGKSGAFYQALKNGLLPSFSWITPNTNDDGENPCGDTCSLTDADTWLSKFMNVVAASPEYQAGTTLVLVTYDEGNGTDYRIGEDCTNKAADLNGKKPSCHIPLLVIYPYVTAADDDSTWFDDYSITQTVEQMFGLSYLAGADDPVTVSLAGHFGIQAPSGGCRQPGTIQVPRAC
jgi:phospholipase C